MKKSTKIFSAALVLTLCASAVVAVKDVSAADTINGRMSSVTGKQGEEVEVTFSLVDNPGTTMYQIGLDYDKTVLEVACEQEDGSDPVASVVDYGVYGTFTPPNPFSDVLTLIAGDEMSTANITKTGDLFTVTFKIKEDAEPGTYEIKPSGEFYNGNLDLISLNMVEKSTITVECAHKSTKEEQTEPTCTSEGTRKVICTVCGNIVDVESIPALGHAYDEGIVTKEATCTEAGEKKYTCTRCGDVKTEETPAAGHKYNESEVTKEPSCTEAGERKYTCTVCHEETTEEIPALGHQAEWKVVKEATETVEGLEQSICSICGEILDEKVIPVVEKVTEPETEKQTETETEKQESGTGAAVTENQNPEKESAKIPATGDYAPLVILGFIAATSAVLVIIQRKREF